MPLDKEKGVVKDEDILSGVERRFFGTSEKGMGPRAWGYHRCIIFSGGLLHRAIDTTETTIMIFFIRTPSRRVCGEVGNTAGVFQGACAVFCIDRSGCESTQST